MTTDELIAHLKREAEMYAQMWIKLNGGTLSYEMQIKLAGYDQAVLDAEAAVVSHERGNCVICPDR